jgi:hypothetical protein
MRMSTSGAAAAPRRRGGVVADPDLDLDAKRPPPPAAFAARAVLGAIVALTDA